MAIARELALTDAERDEILDSEWNLRIATHSPSGRINLTPLWFVWHDDKVWTYCRGQKVVNLRANPDCTVLIDRAERFAELQGVMIQGRAEVLEDADAEAAAPGLDRVRVLFGTKYAGGHGEPEGAEPTPNTASARGRTARWLVITPTSTVTWDNHKLPK